MSSPKVSQTTKAGDFASYLAHTYALPLEGLVCRKKNGRTQREGQMEVEVRYLGWAYSREGD